MPALLLYCFFRRAARYAAMLRHADADAAAAFAAAADFSAYAMPPPLYVSPCQRDSARALRYGALRGAI